MTTKTADASLHLPRLLFLHGGGTNARIFRCQCRVLEPALRPFFRLCYVEAPFPSAWPGPDVTSVYGEMGPFKAWLNQDSTSTVNSGEAIKDAVSDALEHDDSLGATGRVVGVLGFSQGARASGSLLYARQILNRRASSLGCRFPDLKFAVLLAGRGDMIPLLDDGCCRDCELGPACANGCSTAITEDHEMLALPTLHVHGLQDPGLDLHRKFMVEYFEPSSASVIEWEGAHRVAIKTQDITALVEGIMRLAQRAGRRSDGTFG